MNRTYETFAKYHSINGISGEIYAQPKRRMARRGSLARAKAAIRAFLDRLKARRACRVSGLVLASLGLAATVGLLEAGIFPVLPALLLGSVSAGLFLLFLRRDPAKK